MSEIDEVILLSPRIEHSYLCNSGTPRASRRKSGLGTADPTLESTNEISGMPKVAAMDGFRVLWFSIIGIEKRST